MRWERFDAWLMRLWRSYAPCEKRRCKPRSPAIGNVEEGISCWGENGPAIEVRPWRTEDLPALMRIVQFCGEDVSRKDMIVMLQSEIVRGFLAIENEGVGFAAALFPKTPNMLVWKLCAKPGRLHDVGAALVHRLQIELYESRRLMIEVDVPDDRDDLLFFLHAPEQGFVATRLYEFTDRGDPIRPFYTLEWPPPADFTKGSITVITDYGSMVKKSFAPRE